MVSTALLHIIFLIEAYEFVMCACIEQLCITLPAGRWETHVAIVMGGKIRKVSTTGFTQFLGSTLQGFRHISAVSFLAKVLYMYVYR